jgi:hypothetical protein
MSLPYRNPSKPKVKPLHLPLEDGGEPLPTFQEWMEERRRPQAKRKNLARCAAPGCKMKGHPEEFTWVQDVRFCRLHAPAVIYFVGAGGKRTSFVTGVKAWVMERVRKFEGAEEEPDEMKEAA